jgi:hypothetical protein
MCWLRFNRMLMLLLLTGLATCYSLKDTAVVVMMVTLHNSVHCLRIHHVLYGSHSKQQLFTYIVTD